MNILTDIENLTKQRTYYGDSYFECTCDHTQSCGLVYAFEWHIMPRTTLCDVTLCNPLTHCLYYTREDGIDIEAEHGSTDVRRWHNIYEGLGLCVPAGHPHRIRNWSVYPVRLEALHVLASTDHIRIALEACSTILPDFEAKLLRAQEEYMPFVDRLLVLDGVRYWPNL